MHKLYPPQIVAKWYIVDKIKLIVYYLYNYLMENILFILVFNIFTDDVTPKN